MQYRIGNINDDLYAAITKSNAEEAIKHLRRLIDMHALRPDNIESLAALANKLKHRYLAEVTWTALKRHLMPLSSSTSVHLIETYLAHNLTKQAQQVLEYIQDEKSGLHLSAKCLIMAHNLDMENLIKTCNNIPDSSLKEKKMVLTLISKVIFNLEKQSSPKYAGGAVIRPASDKVARNAAIISKALKFTLDELKRLKIPLSAEIASNWIHNVDSLENAVSFMAYTSSRLGHQITPNTIEKLIDGIQGPNITLAWQLWRISREYIQLSPSDRVASSVLSVINREESMRKSLVAETSVLKDLSDSWKTHNYYTPVDTSLTVLEADRYLQKLHTLLSERTERTLIFQNTTNRALDAQEMRQFTAIVDSANTELSEEIEQFKKQAQFENVSSLLKSIFERYKNVEKSL